MRILENIIRKLGDLLEKTNVIEQSRLRATINLAWPRIATGLARKSQQTADVAMVGIVLGPSAIAGLAFAYAYWQIGNRLSLGLSGGAISLVSQHYGGGKPELANRAIIQSYLLATILAAPFVMLFYWHAGSLISLMSNDFEAIEHGAAYLTVLAPAVIFEFYNKIASRIFAGIGDTFTPMLIRGIGAVMNIFLNIVLIFGMGLGVVGAALGTVISTVLITIALMWGLVGKPYPNRDPLPVRFALSGPIVDPLLLRPLIGISTPLMFQELARAVFVFPLLSIAAVFGSVVVAGYEVGRRIRDLLNSLSWGFSMASSSLVGRHLGAGEENTATSYGTEIIRLSFLSYIIGALFVIIFAHPISRLFATDPDVVDLAASFIRIAAVASIGLGLDSSATGALRGAGDTRWPFYGAIIGLYVFTIPVTYFGVMTPLGISALYLSLLVETFVPASVSLYRYYSGKWRGVSRSIRQQANQSVD